MGILTTHNTHHAPYPTCPHCGYEMNTDDMLANEDDLFALAPSENSAAVKCPQCDNEYAVLGGYKPHYTSAFSIEELM